MKRFFGIGIVTSRQNIHFHPSRCLHGRVCHTLPFLDCRGPAAYIDFVGRDSPPRAAALLPLDPWHCMQQPFRMLSSFWEMTLANGRYNPAVGSSANRGTARWLTVEQIRKQQRMRRETVVAAMLRGDLPFEQRGRIRYARVSDIEAWERSRIARATEPTTVLVHPDLVGLSQA